MLPVEEEAETNETGGFRHDHETKKNIKTKMGFKREENEDYQL